MVSALTNAVSVSSFGQILQRDECRAEKELNKFFGKETSKRNTNVARDKNGNVKRILNFCPLKFFVQSNYCLLDIKAVPNFISTTFVDRMCFTTSPTKRFITVADGTMKKCREVVTNVSIIFVELRTKIDFLVIKCVLARVLIKMP